MLRKIGSGVYLIQTPLMEVRIAATRSEDCPELMEENNKKLREYMSQFQSDL